MSFGSIYPLKQFVFFSTTHKWSFKFKFCKMVADNIRHAKKYIIHFHIYFDRVECLIVKFVDEIQAI
jgi:hypothetical protein